MENCSSSKKAIEFSIDEMDELHNEIDIMGSIIAGVHEMSAEALEIHNSVKSGLMMEWLRLRDRVEKSILKKKMIDVLGGAA